LAPVTTFTTESYDVCADDIENGENDMPIGESLSTVSGGKLSEAVEEQGTKDHQMDESEPGNMVRNALSQAQYITRSTRGRRPHKRDRDSKSRSGYSGSGPDDRDPQRAGGVLGSFLDARGWNRPLAEARVFADWPSLVGADIAARCQPVALREGELRIAAESTAWATQLRMMAGTLLASLVKELGPDVVTKVLITGPTGPTWKHGAWSVRGSRGPRDTYG
jgi:predicted nucleic acid-binding Zn ribbon protein